MPVTKYDLNTLANSYFITYYTVPKHPVTPDVCADFCYNCYGIIFGMMQGTNSKLDLYRYIAGQAEYYGVDLKKANEFLTRIPGIQQIFIQFLKDNYRIETNSEIIKRLVGDAFGFVGDLASGAVKGFLKPFIPIMIFGLIFIIAFRQATAPRKKAA